MPYAILRFKKCKAGSVTACYAHNERKKESYKSNPDIEQEYTPYNYHLVQPKQTYRREVTRMITAAGCKARSNSTVMVETLITASPEFMNPLPAQQKRAFFEKALAFVGSKVGKDNIISAVVHMDEKTPHMHLSFCPIVERENGGKSLSAKALLGNQATLARWQDAYHAAMSEQWPELERGISSLVTKRKHIPLSLFKMAKRLDKEFGEVKQALADLTVFNAGKKRDEALSLLAKWVPEAERFSVHMKKLDGYIKDLEQGEKNTQERIKEAEGRGDERVLEIQHTMSKALDAKDDELAEKDKQIAEAKRKTLEAAETLNQHKRNFERLIGKLPFDVRKQLMEIQKQNDEQNKQNIQQRKERGNAR